MLLETGGEGETKIAWSGYHTVFVNSYVYSLH